MLKIGKLLLFIVEGSFVSFESRTIKQIFIKSK